MPAWWSKKSRSNKDSEDSSKSSSVKNEKINNSTKKGRENGNKAKSSSGSSGDHAPHADQSSFSGHVDKRFSPLRPGQGLRCRTISTSSFHGWPGGIDMDSVTRKLENGQKKGHRLPLPPGSPTSPSALSTPPSPDISKLCSNNTSKWRKGKLLARGTLCPIYLGFNSETGHMCAIKEVKVVSDDQSSKECLKQIHREITLLNNLSHPNIVRYYGSELNEQRLSVYLEYVCGGSVHDLLQQCGSFEEPVIQKYTRQILTGLAYLHERNIVHRYIKGANVLVDPNGEIKLANFGMAKHIASSSTNQFFKGRLYWMAPELVRRYAYTPAVDIWSLGCTVLEMATSKPPWSQLKEAAAMFKIANSKDPPEIPHHLSADAKNFITLCLQRQPLARPTASELLRHPFVRNQITMRQPMPILHEKNRAFGGSCRSTALELYNDRTDNSLFDRDDASRLMLPRILLSPGYNARKTTSMPVSPTWNPL